MVDVNVTHSLSPTITNFADFDDESFVNRFNQENSSLILSIIEAEVVVVNGEGTLNRISKGSLNLLFIMYISKKFFNKKVHVINFSCFPNGDASIPTGKSLIYPSVSKHMDRVMVRDHLSKKFWLIVELNQSNLSIVYHAFLIIIVKSVHIDRLVTFWFRVVSGSKMIAIN